MHEWALAEAIISTVSQVAEKEGLREVNEVHLKVGELQQVNREILEFALREMKSGKLANAKFIIRESRATFKCRVCSHKWFLKNIEASEEVMESIHFIPEVAYAYIRCPKCGSPDFSLSGGRGVWVSGIRGVK
ncbi:MAG: hydrogenase nickel incorporation protein HypA [Candidatus Bathyarchaeota archaeon]|nr:hydrogenase nickel incorporation protein HypA [Candidatus Bathyarchaeota archaeon]